MVSSRANVIPARLISACLRCSYPRWPPSSLIPPPTPLHGPQFFPPNKTSFPHFCFIRSSLFLSIFLPTRYLITFVPSLRFFFFLFLYRCANLSHSHEPFPILLSTNSPIQPFCNGMMSEEPSLISIDVCQLGQTHG